MPDSNLDPMENEANQGICDKCNSEFQRLIDENKKLKAAYDLREAEKASLIERYEPQKSRSAGHTKFLPAPETASAPRGTQRRVPTKGAAVALPTKEAILAHVPENGISIMELSKTFSAKAMNRETQKACTALVGGLLMKDKDTGLLRKKQQTIEKRQESRIQEKRRDGMSKEDAVVNEE